MDPYQTVPTTHPGLPPLRLVNRRTQEHAGPCPFCGGDAHRSDRFRVWLEPGKQRYWCRACNERGPLRKLLGDERPTIPHFASPRRKRHQVADPAPADAAHYRAIYTAVALWAHTNLLDLANPEPLAYLHARGINEDTIGRAVLGVTRRDPLALADYLRREHADLLPYAEAAGVLMRDGDGWRTHPNLCGCLVFPYLAEGVIVDLRTRSYPGKGYRSLAGSYSERGATSPFGGDDVGDADTVLITEGEIKALIATQAYAAGRLSAPALAHPGLSYLREEWGAQLLARGVHTVILAYDSQPRPVKDGSHQLAPEEVWTIRHGLRLAAAGLHVRVLRLPLAPGTTKADLDEFTLAHGPARLQRLIDAAPSLDAYHRSLPHGLLKQAKLPSPGSYPLHRARPQRVETARPVPAQAAPTITPAEARAQIPDLVRDHVTQGAGILALAHPPGTGKGYGTTAALQTYLQSHPSPGKIVWTGLRKAQVNDQHGLPLIAIHGRNPGNCRKFDEAQALTQRGYSVTHALCLHRCPFVDYCIYRAQLRQDGHLFAPQSLLQATSWWQEAGVIVLDEFDPAILARIIDLNSTDLARMGRGGTDPHAQTILRWLMILLGSAADRQLAGVTLLSELEALAVSEGLDLGQSLRAALDALPSQEEIHRLRSLPPGATITAYETLPPNYLETILTRLDHERRRALIGGGFTSRLEISGGRLWLYLRAEQLIAQLARPEQPKLILDATISTALLQALFPTTPLHIERPRISGGASVTQVITRDWAKSTLRGAHRERWFDEVARHIRPSRPTLVVCTLACEADLRTALRARGHDQTVVAHYGALRGSNAYKGYDIILAQVYHPNLDAIIRQGRALFADDAEPLNETMITNERTLTDAAGESWVVQVPTFADPRLAALLEQARESELIQVALRGRPFDYPEAQITLLFGLPLPSLPPTIVCEGVGAAPTSNTSRTRAARATVAGAAQELLESGTRVISVEDLAQTTGLSVVTVRRHIAAVAGRLGLRLVQQRRLVTLSHGGQRSYTRWVLMRRGRAVPPPEQAPDCPMEQAEVRDHADNMDSLIRVIHAPPRRMSRLPRIRRPRRAASQTRPLRRYRPPGRRQ